MNEKKMLLITGLIATIGFLILLTITLINEYTLNNYVSGESYSNKNLIEIKSNELTKNQIQILDDLDIKQSGTVTLKFVK